MDCYCEYEEPQFFSKATHKARAQHRCDECYRTIVPGERYERVRGVWDGTFSMYKMCPRCIALRDHLAAHVPCFCWPFTGLLENARETIRSLPREAHGSGFLFELGRMAVAIKRTPKYQRAGGAQKDAT